MDNFNPVPPLRGARCTRTRDLFATTMEAGVQGKRSVDVLIERPCRTAPDILGDHDSDKYVFSANLSGQRRSSIMSVVCWWWAQVD